MIEPARARRQTARWLELVYGGPPDLFDPAEAYHEASKVSPTQVGRQVAGAARLEATPDLQLSMTRAVRRLPVPRRELPAPRRPDVALWQAIAERRSCRRFDAAPVSGHDLAGLLESGYGVTHALEEHALPLRAVPSGGALYPLEVYVAAFRIEGLEPGLYHFDPLAPALAVVHDSLAADDVSSLSTYPEIIAGSAAVMFIAAVFGRTRFKYGLTQLHKRTISTIESRPISARATGKREHLLWNVAGQVSQSAPVGVHQVDVAVAAAVADEADPLPVGRPAEQAVETDFRVRKEGPAAPLPPGPAVRRATCRPSLPCLS